MLSRVLWYCYKLSRNQWLKPSELKNLQENRLKVILKHAYENVPLYKKKFNSVNIKPEDIKVLENIGKLPLTTKQEIYSGLPDQSIARGYDLHDCVKMSTSGTTGGPMPVYYDKRFFDYYITSWGYRSRMAINLKPWDRTLRINYHTSNSHHNGRKNKDDLGKPRKKTALGLSFFFFKRWRKTAIISSNIDEIAPELVKYRPRVISANASYLRLLAEAKISNKISDLHLKGLISTSEVLDDPTRNFVDSTFKSKVFNHYGAWEVGRIGWECERREGLHIDADLIILEILGHGTHISPHEPGEIVVTGLMNYAMPLIRYRIGDIGILKNKICSCGRSLPLLESMEGRIIDCFHLPDERVVTPKTIATVVQGTEGVSRYQVVQESINKVKIQLMRSKEDPDVSIQELKARCHKVFGDDVDIEVSIGTRENLKAKFRPVISKLTVDKEPRWTEPHRQI